MAITNTNNSNVTEAVLKQSIEKIRPDVKVGGKCRQLVESMCNVKQVSAELAIHTVLFSLNLEV